LQPTELWPQERQLCAKAAEGGLLDLRCRRPAEDDPIRGGEWDRDRWVRAQVLFQLLTGNGPQLSHSAVAVRLRGAQIVGRLNLGGWKLRCPLELYQCYLHCRLDLAKAEAPNISLRGSFLRSRLSARRLRVVHTLNLTGFRCDGGVALGEAHISGLLDCDEAVFSNPNGRALSAFGLTVDAGMSLRKAQCTGKVRMTRAHIGGQLDCTEAVFSNRDGQALDAAGLTVGAGMSLGEVRCTGEAHLFHAHIGGQLFCDEAVFSNPNGRALSADGLTVDGLMSFGEARCTGAVQLAIAHIGGYLNCDEAVFSNPNGLALNAEELTVGTGMSLGKARCIREVRLSNAHIGGKLDCTDAVFCNPQGLAVDLELASVAQAVVMRPAVFYGGLDLHHAQVGVWYDEKRTWPERLRLEGFVYDSINAPDATIKDRVRSWLPRIGYLPQPYEQLAGMYRREGNEQAARIVAIGKQRARRADVHGWTRWPSRAWSGFLRCTIGYGYRPMLALIWLAVLVVLGSLIFAVGHPNLLRPAKPGSPEQPGFNSFRYTVDLLLPVANFKQRDSFVAGGWVAWASFGFIFAGWLLAAIVVAGLTGVFKRD
jgi:hypothetical protein